MRPKWKNKSKNFETNLTFLDNYDKQFLSLKLAVDRFDVLLQ